MPDQTNHTKRLFDLLIGPKSIAAKLRCTALVTALAVSLICQAGASAQSLPIKVNAELFGLNISNWKEIHPQDYTASRYVSNLPPANIHYRVWRIMDNGVNWYNIERTKGQYDWTDLDKCVAAAEHEGAEIIYAVQGTPEFYASNHAATCTNLMGNTSPPTDPAHQFKPFVHALVQRYKGRIKYYEGWNEPGHYWNVNNVPNFVPVKGCLFSGTPEQLVQLQAIMYTEAKSVDPSCQVLSPAMWGGNAELVTDYDLFLKLGGRHYFDIPAFHFYVSSWQSPLAAPEEIQGLATAMRNELAKYGFPATTPIISTEAGWCENGFPAQLGSAYVARAYLISALAGLKSYDFYAWNINIAGPGHPLGWLTLNDSYSSTVYPAGRAFQTIQNWLIGSTITRYTCSPSYWTMHLTLKNGVAARIVWRQDNQEGRFGVPTSWGNTAVDIDNTSVPIEAGEIRVGAKPILIYQK